MWEFYILTYITMKDFLKSLKKFFEKLITRFSNYKNTKKRFVLYLIGLTIVLLCFSVLKVWDTSYRMLNFSHPSAFIVLLSLIGLFCWNLSTSFKNWITRLCALREDEPLVDFGFLWMIVCVFMGIIDMVPIVHEAYGKVEIGWNALFVWLVLLAGLVWSFVSVWKVSSKSSKKTKILNIVEENHTKSDSQKPTKVTHLFDDLGDE